MRFQKRLLSLLTSVLLVVSLLGGFPASAANSALIGEGTDLPAPKIFIIGNSYSNDIMTHLNSIFLAEGIDDFVLGYLYYPGRGLGGHLSAAKGNVNDYDYYKSTSKSWVKTPSTSILTALQDEQWDLIYLQQSPLHAGLPSSHSDLNALMQYVDQNKTNSSAKLGWHMTWSYAESYKTGNTYSESFVNYFQGDHLTMYNAIADTVQSVILPKNFVSVIPAGTALENARTSYFGDTLNRDGYHLSEMGRIIASYCWYATLTGKTLETMNFKHSSLHLSDKDKQVIIEAVNNACKNPYAVTPSVYPPTYAITVSGGGQAEVNGEKVTEAPKDATVTLRFDNSSKCVQFNGWEVREGGITLTDPTNPVTSFVMPDEKVSIRANVTYNCPALRMTDVSSTGWYHDAVDYVLENGIMSGYDRSTFGTNDTLTRAQVVQVLYNKEGKPAVTAENQFKDVPADQWFFDAVRWAADKGVVSGVGDGNFNPNGKITLEQAAVILHNYSGKPTASAELNAIGNYSSWAADALRWCVANNLLKDIPFENATDAATRAQTAQILYNYLTK